MKKILTISAVAVTVVTAALAGVPERVFDLGIKQISRVRPQTAPIVQKNIESEVISAKIEGERPADAINVPFTHPLTKGDASLALYTIVDANGDGKTWKLGGLSSGSVCMINNSSVADAKDADDWLLSVPVYLEGGKAIVPRLTVPPEQPQAKKNVSR